MALGERGSGLLARLKTELELTPEEMEKISTALQAEFVAIKNAGPPGTGASQDEMREQARMRIAKVLRTVLEPREVQEIRGYGAAKAERTAPRHAMGV